MQNVHIGQRLDEDDGHEKCHLFFTNNPLLRGFFITLSVQNMYPSDILSDEMVEIFLKVYKNFVRIDI